MKICTKDEEVTWAAWKADGEWLPTWTTTECSIGCGRVVGETKFDVFLDAPAPHVCLPQLERVRCPHVIVLQSELAQCASHQLEASAPWCTLAAMPAEAGACQTDKDI